MSEAAEFTKQEEGRIRVYFRVSVLLKGIISLAEVLAGIVVIFIPLSAITDFIVHYGQQELMEEPGDFIATHLIQLSHEFAIPGGAFLSLYLLSRGLIKLGLVVALLKNQLWAYPSSLVVLGLFVLYQLYQIVVAPSAFMILLTAFDLIVMWSILEEYRVMRAHLAARAARQG